MQYSKKINDFRNWLSVEEEASPNTIESYMFSVNNFFKNYDEVSKENILDWKKQLESGKSPATVNLRLNAIAKYCKFADIPMNIKRIKIQEKCSVENVITLEQYGRLIDGLTRDGELRWAAYIKILAKTGARVSEALRFTKKDLDSRKCTIHTKGKIRTIKFPQSLIEDIADLFSECNDSDRLITNRFGKPMTSRGVSGQLKTYAKKYGIPPESAHPHSFRHLFAIEFLKRNNNISLLADLLGHSGLNTTMIYLRMSQEQQYKALDEAVNW